jgi:peptide/nickel transport system substrate-binding protein
MRKRSLALVVGAVAIVASLVIGPGASAKAERAQAGQVVFIHDQEPPTMRNNWEDNNLYATSLVVNRIFEGCQYWQAPASLVPRLCESKPRITKQRPLTVRFKYKNSARWSDGRQVTCNDFKATWRVFVNPRFNVVSRSGWDEIRRVSCRGKNATVVFKQPYADWESVVSSSIYPNHIIKGQDMNRMFNDSIPVSNGPFLFERWQKGVQLSVRRNPGWRPRMKLDRIIFRYILDTNSRFQALKANEGQVMEPQPQLQIAEFLQDRSFQVQRRVGFTFEHIDIQFGGQGHPALKKRFVREALIRGMNRPQVASALFRTIAPGIPALQSLIYKPFERTYPTNFRQYAFNQRRAIQLLRQGGCTGGPAAPSAGNNDIYECPGVGKLSFRFFTTTGNQFRALTFEIIQRQLKSIGIELVPRFQTGGTLFGTTLPSSNWDLIMFTYLQVPTSKITAKDLYACRGDQNYGLSCDNKLTRILNRVPRVVDDKAREALLQSADKRIARQIISIPMFARPSFFITRNSVKGTKLNLTLEGSTWNASVWQAG